MQNGYLDEELHAWISWDEKDLVVPELSSLFPAQEAQLHRYTKSEERSSIYTGPGKAYERLARVKPSEQIETTVYYAENGYVFTHARLKSLNVYGWLARKAVEVNGDLPEVDHLDYYEGSCDYWEVITSGGPGETYKQYPELAVSEVMTTIRIFFQENGYYYAEYDQEDGRKMRMWVPADSVVYLLSKVSFLDE